MATPTPTPTRTNSSEWCTSSLSSSSASSPNHPSRAVAAPGPTTTTSYRGLSPETKSLARLVFNSEANTQADQSSGFCNSGPDWLLGMISDMMSEIENLDTTELRRGSFAENVKRAQEMYKDLVGTSTRQREGDGDDLGSSASGSNNYKLC